MRYAFLVCLVWLTHFSLSAKLHPHTTASQYAHLVEVNPRWLHEASPARYLEAQQFRNETERIYHHFLAVLDVLTTRATPHLSAGTRAARRQSLQQLAAYAEARRFPLNLDHPARTPFFVDVEYTHCAVGHLLRESGAANTVAKIQAQTNNGFVLPDLLKHPELGDWAERNGFTGEELAWIQPGYPAGFYLKPAPFGNNSGVTGGEVLTAVPTAQHGLFVGGSFSSFDGMPSNGLVQVAGASVRPVDNPYERIQQLTVLADSARLLCLGVPTQASDSLELSLFEASTETFQELYRFARDTRVYVHQDSLAELLVLAGSMAHDTSAILLYRLNPETQAMRSVATEYSLRGAIYDSYFFDQSVTLGGRFTAHNATDSLVDLNQVRYDPQADTLLPDNNTPIRTQSGALANPAVFRYVDPSIYTSADGSEFSATYLSIAPSRDSLLIHFTTCSQEDGLCKGEQSFLNDGFVYTGPEENLFFHEIDGFLLGGPVNFTGRDADSVGTTRLIARNGPILVGDFFESRIPIDGTVRAWVPHGDSVFVAGTFSSLNGDALKQLAWARPIVSDVAETSPPEAQVYYANQQVHLAFEEPLADDAQLYLYSSDGRLHQRLPLPPGQSSYSFPLTAQAAVLHFAVHTSHGVSAGTLVAPAH